MPGTGTGVSPRADQERTDRTPRESRGGKVFGALHGFRVCKGARYLGGYIVDNKFKRYWLKECAVVRTIQSEWIFLQRITWDTGESFAGVEKMIRETFLPYSFFGKTKTLSPVIVYLITMPVNKSGLRLLNPVTSSQ